MPISEILGAIPPDIATHAVNDALQVGSQGRKVLGRLIGKALRAGMVTDEQFYTQKPIKKEEELSVTPDTLVDVPAEPSLQTPKLHLPVASPPNPSKSTVEPGIRMIPLYPSSSTFNVKDIMSLLEAKAEALKRQQDEDALKEQQKKEAEEAAERQKAQEKERQGIFTGVAVNLDTSRLQVRRPLGDIRRPGTFIPRDRYGRPLLPPPYMLPLHMRPPMTISPYDMRPDAIRARGWVPHSGPMGTPPGWVYADSPEARFAGPGTVVIRRWNDMSGGPTALREHNPNSPFGGGIRIGYPYGKR